MGITKYFAAFFGGLVCVREINAEENAFKNVCHLFGQRHHLNKTQRVLFDGLANKYTRFNIIQLFEYSL